MTCSRCKKRPAVVFMTRIEGDKTINEGLCLVCAKDLGIKPVDELMKKFGISDEDLEAFADQFIMPGESNSEDGDFEAGGSPAFPGFLPGFMPDNSKNIPDKRPQYNEQQKCRCDNCRRRKQGKLCSAFQPMLFHGRTTYPLPRIVCI